MLVKCEEPIYELIFKVWLLYHHPNFKYRTLFVSRTELRTDRRTDKWTDRQTIRLLDAPAELSGRGIKIENCRRTGDGRNNIAFTRGFYISKFDYHESDQTNR